MAWVEIKWGWYGSYKTVDVCKIIRKSGVEIKRYDCLWEIIESMRFIKRRKGRFALHNGISGLTVKVIDSKNEWLGLAIKWLVFSNRRLVLSNRWLVLSNRRLGLTVEKDVKSSCKVWFRAEKSGKIIKKIMDYHKSIGVLYYGKGVWIIFPKVKKQTVHRWEHAYGLTKVTYKCGYRLIIGADGCWDLFIM